MHGFDLLDIDAQDLRAAMAQAEERHRAAIARMNEIAADAAARDLSVFRMDGAAPEDRLHEAALDSLADLHPDDDVMAAAHPEISHGAEHPMAEEISHPAETVLAGAPELDGPAAAHDGHEADPHGEPAAPGSHDGSHDPHDGDIPAGHDDVAAPLAGHPDDHPEPLEGDPHAELLEALAQLAAGAGHEQETTDHPPVAPGHDGEHPVEASHDDAPADDAHPLPHPPSDDPHHGVTLAELDAHPVEDLAASIPAPL